MLLHAFTLLARRAPTMNVVVKKVYTHLALPALVPLVLALLALNPAPGRPTCPDILLAAVAIIATTALHEELHYLAAHLVGVRGVRLKTSPLLGALILDYDSATPKQLAIVALAPQALNAALAALTILYPQYAKPLYAALVVNVAASMLDLGTAALLLTRHRRAKQVKPLYDENGVIVGAVIEYSDKIIVYTQ